MHNHQRENHLADDRLCLKELHRSSVAAREEFETNLLELEKQMDKYIQFKTISGWKLLQ
jgi:transposase